MKARKLILIIWVVLLCNACFAGSLVGQSAPEITLREWVTENPPGAKDLAGGVWVAEFWATWCRPCVDQVEHLIKLTDTYGPMGVEFVSLSQDKLTKIVHKFVRDKGINYNVAIDNGTADWFGVLGYPTVFVINHLGKVAWKGYPWDKEFEKEIQKAVKAGPPPLLKGVNLGPFDYLKEPLRGGRKFANSYHKIRAQINNPKKSATAKKIVDTIDQRINQQTRKAQGLQQTDPSRAYHIYRELVKKYDGIEVVKPAKAAYLEMKKRRHTPAGFRNLGSLNKH